MSFGLSKCPKSDTTATMCAAADSRNNDGASPWNGIVDELVVKRSFYLLLEQEESAERFVNVLQRLGQLPYVDEDQRLTVERSSERIVHLIYSSPQPAPWKANDFASRGWVIDSTNVYSEFSRVAEVIFQDDINWGRIVAFIGFAVAFSVHSVQNGLEETVIDSIFGWTIQVIRGRLHSWLQEHSWVSCKLLNTDFRDFGVEI